MLNIIYKLTKNIKGVDKEKLENEVIILGDKEYMLKFLRKCSKC